MFEFRQWPTIWYFFQEHKEFSNVSTATNNNVWSAYLTEGVEVSFPNRIIINLTSMLNNNGSSNTPCGVPW